ncbi:MAG: ComEA family DNA-binding protein [Bacteroidota bacterium]
MLTWIKAIFRLHFGFSKAESNGTLVLLLLMSSCLLVPQGIKWYYRIQPTVTHNQDIVLLERALATLEHLQQKPRRLASAKQLPPVSTRYYPKKTKLAHQPQLFDINTADAVQLSAIRGIGPVLSARIVKFRDQLGGFVSCAQYQEVYGLCPEVVTRLKQHTYINASFCPTKLDINIADAQTLAMHPYITYQQAKSIVNYRAQHGPFIEINALNTLVLIDQSTLEKLTPYLYVSP